jgi:hypothetical protein
MAYINEGQLLEVNGRPAIATSRDYTRMVYTAYDYELGRAGLEGGRAVGCVRVRFPDAEQPVEVQLKFVRKVA